MLKTVKLYGHLGKKFGREFRFDIRTPAEAIRALKANCEGFVQYLSTNDKPGYWVFVGKENKGKEQLNDPFGSKEIIKIVPAIAGAGGDSGIFQLIGGIVLIAVGAFTSNAFLVQAGFALAVGGVAQLAFAPPKSGDPEERPENKPSLSFNGPINTTKQGQPVPLLYGKLMVGSAVISSGISTDQQ